MLIALDKHATSFRSRQIRPPSTHPIVVQASLSLRPREAPPYTPLSSQKRMSNRRKTGAVIDRALLNSPIPQRFFPCPVPWLAGFAAEACRAGAGE
jgi:hypothetical protein